MSTPPPPDRSMSPVGASGPWYLRSLKAKKAMLGGAVVLVGGLAYMSWHAGSTDKGPPSTPEDTGSASIAQVTNNPPVSAPAEQPKVAPPPAAVAMSQAAPITSQPAAVAGAIDYVRMPSQDAEEAFTVAIKPAEPARQVGGSGASPKPEAETTVDFKTTTIEGAKAGRAMNMAYVMQPQAIPCALDNAMDSTLAGAIFCHTTADVLSPSHIVLMPAHTLITGTYKNDVRSGQARLFAFVGNAFTPEGIPVPLNSSVGDGLGRAGIQATSVDEHYGERFGAAIALTGAQGALGIAQAEVSKGGNTYLDLNSGGGASSVATQILQSQINIPPTISVSPGTQISVIVDHPVDFSAAIKVTTNP